MALGSEALARVEAELSERAVPAGGYVCRKGEPVNVVVNGGPARC